MQWTTDDIMAATHGEQAGDARRICFEGISIDSRKISPTDFFVAIHGDVHDGHRFCEDVIQKGVRGILVENRQTQYLPVADWQRQGIACITVTDTTRALGDMAAYHRRRLNVRVVAITGSNGKTTTRGMTSEVLKQRFRVLSTAGNLNNHIGLPLTLLNLDINHECAVVELGMNHSGEIERLSEICRPDIGVITMIGTAHLENFSSQDDIAKAKAELFRHLQPDGSAVLNLDDSRLEALAPELSAPVIFFGTADTARVRARQIVSHGAQTSFILDLPNDSAWVRLPVAGIFMISNALAAASVGYAMGLSAAEIKTGLENFKPEKGRMNIVTTAWGVHIVDDTYNANPASMTAAVQTLLELKGAARGIVIVGDMLELGKDSPHFHRRLGEQIASAGMSELYATGDFSPDVADGAVGFGMSPESVFVGSLDAIRSRVTESLQKNDWILIKGSRAMGMEKITGDIIRWAGHSSGSDTLLPFS